MVTSFKLSKEINSRSSNLRYMQLRIGFKTNYFFFIIYKNHSLVISFPRTTRRTLFFNNLLYHSKSTCTHRSKRQQSNTEES